VGARCVQSDEDKIGGNRWIGVHDRSCRGLATAGTTRLASRFRQADAQPRPRYIPRSNPRVRSCLERETARDENVRRSEWWREAPAAEPLGAWHA
jgi:hypothetical protein